MHEDHEFMRVMAQSIDRDEQRATLDAIGEDIAKVQAQIARGLLGCGDVAHQLERIAAAIRATTGDLEWGAN